MSATDAGFLYLERPTAPLHLGVVAILDGALSAPELAARMEARLPRLPRYAQRPRNGALGMLQPVWEDAPRFDVRDHVQRWGVPQPGDEHELLEIAARLIAAPLVRHRPLWEMHLLEGLEGGRSALLAKVHHCVADGVAGAYLLEQLLDPPPSLGKEGASRRSTHRPLRRGPALRELRELVSPRRGLSGASGLGRLPSDLIQSLREAAPAVARLATHRLAALPWNARLSGRRSLSFLRLPLEGARRIRAACDGTLNDVVLSLLGGGLHRYLQATGIGLAGRSAMAMVPVSLRTAGEEQALGNRISMMAVPLPVDVPDDFTRLDATRAITRDLKARGAWVGIGAVLAAVDRLPAPLLAVLARALPLDRLANVIATNVRGPHELRHLCGRRVEALYPVVPIADGIGLGVAAFSYAGWLHLGLNADPVLVPDLDKLRLGLEESYRALLRACCGESIVERSNRAEPATPRRAASRLPEGA
jgi:WS/DGAT/MGAT family acyltransferase